MNTEERVHFIRTAPQRHHHVVRSWLTDAEIFASIGGRPNVKNLSDETLKRLWASEWPAGDIKFGIYLDEVFTELTARGYAV
ncbi:hypothetical protein [Azorhizobium caulinodans]|uniref:hypothetical protein n=1 Tax=Azorhizobium caulinodans TaxID=7 RepID=UPI002FBD7AB0